MKDTRRYASTWKRRKCYRQIFSCKNRPVPKELIIDLDATDATLHGKHYRQFGYGTRDSWSRERRVIAKAEYIKDKENLRCVVTSLTHEEAPPRQLYEDRYCARGDMENRIKEQRLDMFADRTSTEFMRGNQIRPWFSTVAYTLVQLLREYALVGTEMARAQRGTIREKLFKIAGRIEISVRKVWIHFSKSYPYKDLFSKIADNLKHLPEFET